MRNVFFFFLLYFVYVWMFLFWNFVFGVVNWKAPRVEMPIDCAFSFVYYSFSPIVPIMLLVNPSFIKHLYFFSLLSIKYCGLGGINKGYLWSIDYCLHDTCNNLQHNLSLYVDIGSVINALQLRLHINNVHCLMLKAIQQLSLTAHWNAIQIINFQQSCTIKNPLNYYKQLSNCFKLN